MSTSKFETMPELLRQALRNNQVTDNRVVLVFFLFPMQCQNSQVDVTPELLQK